MRPTIVISAQLRALAARLVLVALNFFNACATAAEPLLTIDDSAQRAAALTHELVAANVEERARWMARIDEMPACAARDDDRLIAVEFWAMAAPRHALEYVERFTAGPRRRRALREAALRGWARTDFTAAWAWTKQSSAAEDQDSPKTVLETVAEIDPAKGLAWLRDEVTNEPAKHGPGSAHEERAFAFFRVLVESGNDASCRRLIEEYPAGAVRNQLLFFLGARFAENSWDEAARWANERTGANDAFYSYAPVALQRAKQDWGAAFDWILSVQDSGLRVRLVRALAGNVISREPSMTTAEKILDKLSTASDRHAAYAAFAASGELVRTTPKRILDWAWAIDTKEERRIALLRGYTAWVRSNRDDAIRHLENAGEAFPEERAVVQNFLQRDVEP